MTTAGVASESEDQPLATRSLAKRVFSSRVWLVAVLSAYVVWWSVDRGMQFRTDPDVKVQAAPLVGNWDWRPSLGLLLPFLVGVFTIWLLPRAQRLSFGWFSSLTAALTGAYAITLAGADGWSNVMEPVVHPSEYWYNLDTLPSIGQTIESWSDFRFLLDYSVHLKGHPPGFIVLLQALEFIGLGAPWVTATICWMSLAAVAPGALRLTKLVADETTARRVAPFLVLAPYAIWMATSADAFFACLLIWGTVLIADSTAQGSWKGRTLLGLLGGLVLGCALFSSYGAAMFMFAPLLVVVFARRPSTGRASVRAIGSIAAAALGGAIITGAFLVAGFWWFDGATTTRNFYWWGTASFRPWEYFITANIGALLIAVGPATVWAVGRLGRSRVWILVGAGLLSITAANLSQMSKAEVERIWIPFMVLLIPASATLRFPRVWLATQLGLGLLLQAWLVSKW
jgi:methylthioxylose transferase